MGGGDEGPLVTFVCTIIASVEGLRAAADSVEGPSGRVCAGKTTFDETEGAILRFLTGDDLALDDVVEEDELVEVVVLVLVRSR
jgi:hypothetical protein